jgi:hypothetical protein
MKYLFFLFLLSTFVAQAAVHVNHDGLGEVLLLPYYTTNNGLNTLVTVSNTTEMVKAVKIVFREGKYDVHRDGLNVYLAPKDVWSFAVINNGLDAKVISHDLSCAFFQSPHMLYDGLADPPPPGGFGFAEGMIEIYEMGELDPSYGYGEAVTFENGEPKNCQQIVDNWDINGEWSNSEGQTQMLPASGGLMSSVSLINVTSGTNYSYDAIALNGFYPEGVINHSQPFNRVTQSLSDAVDTSMVLYQGEPVVTRWPTGIQAVSAVLSQHELMIDYSNEMSINAQTEVILSLPTKKEHLSLPEDPAPFGQAENLFNDCERFFPSIVDRDGVVASYVPPNVSPVPPHLCAMVNVVKLWDFYDSETIYYPILDSENTFNQTVIKGKEGMYTIKFDQFTDQGRSLDGTEVHTYHGLPVFALTLSQYTNANAQPGLLAQYGGVYMPSAKRLIEITSAQ